MASFIDTIIKWFKANPQKAAGLGAGALGGGSALYGGYKDQQQQQADRLNPPVDNVFTMDPNQRKFIDQLGGQALTGMQSMNAGQMGDPSGGFEDYLPQANRQWSEQTMPGMAEGFTRMGDGAQRSGGFPLALGQAYGGMQSGLAGKQGEYEQKRQGQQQNWMDLIQGGALQRPFEPLHRQQGQSPWAALGGQALSSLPYFMRNK